MMKYVLGQLSHTHIWYYMGSKWKRLKTQMGGGGEFSGAPTLKCGMGMLAIKPPFSHLFCYSLDPQLLHHSVSSLDSHFEQN